MLSAQEAHDFKLPKDADDCDLSLIILNSTQPHNIIDLLELDGDSCENQMMNIIDSFINSDVPVMKKIVRAVVYSGLNSEIERWVGEDFGTQYKDMKSSNCKLYNEALLLNVCVAYFDSLPKLDQAIIRDALDVFCDNNIDAIRKYLEC